MTETDARAVLLMRSCEQAALVSADDAAWAGREARQQLGAAAAPAAWLARRARLGLVRLAERQPALRPALQAGQDRLPVWLLPLGLAGAMAVGLLAEGLGPSRQINLLALPLLGLLAWNLGVLLLLGWQALRARRAGQVDAAGAAVAQLGDWLLRRLPGRRAAPGAPAEALARFSADWLRHSRPLQAARGRCALHAAAAALAAGAVTALYARGLVFDYRAGWDSTFLQPAQVHALLQLLLGPASALAGLPLPDASALAGLRLAQGGGENAAPWIHRWALTLAGAVVLPRGLLAGWAWRTARRHAADLPLPEFPDLQRLLDSARTTPRQVAVLPYSYRLDAARQAAVAPALAAWLGAGLQCAVQPTLALGDEDRLPHWLPPLLARWPAAADGQPAPLLVLLFALTATPERESHGAVVQALVQALASVPAPRPQLRVAVDVAGYRQRVAGPDGDERLAQRRAAWEALLLGLGVVPGFIDLTAPAGTP